MRTSLWAFAACISAVVLAGSAWAEEAAQSVREGYRFPTYSAPYAAEKPKIDGVIDDAEWAGAVSFNALQTVRGEVHARPARWWMLWDEDNLYVAMRSPLRCGERVTQSLRRKDRDVMAVFDDSYEIWIDAGTKSADDLRCHFQYLGNFAGGRYDAMYIPLLGTRRIGYTAGWAPANRINACPAARGNPYRDGRAWEMEVVIPRRSINKHKPFQAGDGLRMLLARDFKRPWSQASVEGTGSYREAGMYSDVTLVRDAPGVHVLAVGDPAAKTFGLDLAAFSDKAEKLKWTFASDGGAAKSGELVTKPGRLVRARPGLDLDAGGKGYYRVRVTSADGSLTYFDWSSSRVYGDAKGFAAKLEDNGETVRMKVGFNPARDYVRINGDFIDYDDRAAIRLVRLRVSLDGKPVARTEATIDDGASIERAIFLKDAKPGAYEVRMTCLSADGKVLAEEVGKFTKKDNTKFPWWNTKLANMDTVLPPWTPVTCADGVFGVWGRSMKLGPAGLPAAVSSQDRALLARPSVLAAELADGTIAEAKLVSAKPSYRKDHRAVVDTVSRLPGLRIDSKVTVEYDGMYRIDMTLTPDGPVKLNALRVVVPCTNATADYLHCAGNGIRFGYDYRFLPRDTVGRLWDSRSIDGQGMTVGSFVPMLWIGSPAGGLSWWADSDEGWAPDDAQPAIEVRRDGPGSTDLVLNLVSAPLTVEKPRKITFAFQATPLKPQFAGWRKDSWWCGDTFAEWQCGSKAKPPAIRMLAPVPFSFDMKMCKEMVAKRLKGKNGYVFGATDCPAHAVPYGRHNEVFPRYEPDARYFNEHWQSSREWHLYYDKSLTDYMVHNLSEWCRQTGIEGYYSDNTRPSICDNVEAGRGYRLPDGRIQPVFNTFGVRRYFLRVRAAFAEHGKHNKIVTHCTHNFVVPWMAAWDIAYDGETNVIYPEMNVDFMDVWPLARMRATYGAQWGVVFNVMNEYQGKWDFNSPRFAKVFRAYQGWVILHDALPSGNGRPCGQPLWIGRERFGIGAADVTFIPYWADRGIACEVENVCAIGWLRPGKLLLGVINRGEKGEFIVRLDGGKLGLGNPAGWKVSDAEGGLKMPTITGKNPDGTFNYAWAEKGVGEVKHDGKGGLTVPVERHDYRQIIVEK